VDAVASYSPLDIESLAVPDPSPIRLLLNGAPVAITGLRPQTTLLEYLREGRRLTGTKEGCAEGDCGACTVVLAEPTGSGGVEWKAVNACIRLLPSVHGKAVFTVESLRAPDGSLHPVQRALVDCHGSQCGFCTPGFVMSLFALYKNAHRPERETVDDALSGNLCRCTGYLPILTAAGRMYDIDPVAGWRGPGFGPDGSPLQNDEEQSIAQELSQIASADTRATTFEYAADGQRWIAPGTTAELAAACLANPDAQIVAGATDVGLWVTKEHRNLGDLIYTGECAELRIVASTPSHLEIGAAVTLTVACAALDQQWPELHEAWVRFGSVPIRNSGTLGGNVANGSPIGDSMPAMLALGATVVLRRGDAQREITLEDYYLAYRKTVRQPGEFVTMLRVPHRQKHLLLSAYKIAKRFDQDISAVFACFALTLEGGSNDRRIAHARIGCGGVAPIPKRAKKTEALLDGRRWDDATAEVAAASLAEEFAPIGDMRASAAYRRAVLANLLRRFQIESTVSTVAVRAHAAVAPIA